MRVARCLCFMLPLVFGGCGCLFAPCGRRLHVSGHVLDAQHRPVGYATVELGGVRKETDGNGCFYFGGDTADADLNINVTKVGHHPYRASKGFDLYEVVITLAPEQGEQQSSGVWHKLYVDELPRYKTCADQ